MKFKNSHHELPSPGQPVYFLGPTAKETLGTFVGGYLFFFAANNSVRGYYSKWWRPLTEEEFLLVPKESLEVSFIDSREPKKRGRKPKEK